ncbi:MAG: DNA alkylation repair protein [Bacilli bacterium]|nr:DNA alkylation repair protein [Bacilli bacterium]
MPLIDNWGVCDGTCASLKITNKNVDEMWNFLQDYIKSDKEYEVRFAVVMYLNYYTKTKYLKKILKQIEQVKNDEYYVKMAIAWFVAEAYANNREDTLEYINKSKLDNWTFNKAIQKIRESYRVSKEDKEMLNKMKRK